MITCDKHIDSAFFFHWEFVCENNEFTFDKPPQNLSIAFAHEYMRFW